LKGIHSRNLLVKVRKKESYWLVAVLHDQQFILCDQVTGVGIGSGTLKNQKLVRTGSQHWHAFVWWRWELCRFCFSRRWPWKLDFHLLTNVAPWDWALRTFSHFEGHEQDPTICNSDKN
jgi:hypothetical protein